MLNVECFRFFNSMLNQLTISELTTRLARREVSAREAMQSCLNQIQRVDGQIHAFISHNDADALAQADEADKELAKGAPRSRPLPLHTPENCRCPPDDTGCDIRSACCPART